MMVESERSLNVCLWLVPLAAASWRQGEWSPSLHKIKENNMNNVRSIISGPNGTLVNPLRPPTIALHQKGKYIVFNDYDSQ